MTHVYIVASDKDKPGTSETKGVFSESAAAADFARPNGWFIWAAKLNDSAPKTMDAKDFWYPHVGPMPEGFPA